MERNRDIPQNLGCLVKISTEIAPLFSTKMLTQTPYLELVKVTDLQCCQFRKCLVFRLNGCVLNFDAEIFEVLNKV